MAKKNTKETTPRVAKIAAETLKSKLASKKEKTLAGSALAQADKKRDEKVKKK